MKEPNYYVKNGLSPIGAFKKGLLSDDEYIGFLKGNVIKYTIRAGDKTEDATVDIKKAITYLNFLDEALNDSGDSDIMGFDEFREHFNVRLNDLKREIQEFKG